MSTQSILLLEDDANLGLVIQENLEMRGFGVTLCVDGVQGTEAIAKRSFDLCLVDVMMPKKDGFTFARELREAGNAVPVIFLTARAMKQDKIEGFTIGADDYITKPFSMEELILRIQAVLRRSAPGASAANTDDYSRKTYALGSSTFDAANQELAHEGKKRKLTTKESDLLAYLCANMNAAVTRETLLKQVWGNDDYFAGRSMDVYISRLRAYLKKEKSIEIVTVHGKGFKLISK
jgi:DNA-binding response OmpR family regulator